MLTAPTLPAYSRPDGAVMDPVGGHLFSESYPQKNPSWDSVLTVPAIADGVLDGGHLFEECAMRHSTRILPSNQATVVGAAGDIKRRAPSQAFLAIAERRGVVRSISLWCVRAALAFRHDEIRAGQVSTLVAIKAKCARQGHSLVAALDRSPFSGC